MKKIISAALAGCALVSALALGGLVHQVATPTSGGNWPSPVEE